MKTYQKYCVEQQIATQKKGPKQNRNQKILEIFKDERPETLPAAAAATRSKKSKKKIKIHIMSPSKNEKCPYFSV